MRGVTLARALRRGFTSPPAGRTKGSIGRSDNCCRIQQAFLIEKGDAFFYHGPH